MWLLLIATKADISIEGSLGGRDTEQDVGRDLDELRNHIAGEANV
jgi:hypothetical protein